MPDDDKTGAISARKSEHLELCETDEVAFRGKTTLLEEVELIHDALPEMAAGDVDLGTTFCGKELRAPLFIAAMTGGTQQAEAINRDLALMAEEHGIGFGFGSQRPLLAEGIEAGYHIRDVAPTALVLGNIGAVQAHRTPSAELARMVDRCGADALVVHLNPAMEAIQHQGDRDFRGGLETLARLVAELDVPVVVKETGCGLSRSVGERVAAIGVEHVDTSGAGGTSWVGVETLRAQDDQAALGRCFWDWGIPTAASVAQLSGLGLSICATGGVDSGLSVARAIALGATCAGMARPLLQALAHGGIDALDARLRQVIAELRLAYLLSGARTSDELRERPLVLGARLHRWVPSDSPLFQRLP